MQQLEIHMKDDHSQEENVVLEGFQGFQQTDHARQEPNQNTPPTPETNKPDCENCKELANIKENLETQLSDSAKQNFDVLQSLAGKTDEVEALKEELKQTKAQLEDR